MATAANRTILVVDDDPDFLLQTRLQLEEGGYRVIEAGSAAEAELAISAQGPDLVVTDVMMETPEAGFAVCERAKARDPRTPVILVTGFAYETAMRRKRADLERGRAAADEVLEKPVRADELRRAVARLLPG